MPQLLLLRHAKSSWDDPGLSDHERPLAPRGRRAAAALAAHLAREGIRPDLVLCSTALRARQTLEPLAAAQPGPLDVRYAAAVYGASAGELLGLVRSLGPAVASALVVGHDPGMRSLALALARPGEGTRRMRGRFPTGALAVLSFAGSWSDLAPGDAELAAFVVPRDLGTAPS